MLNFDNHWLNLIHPDHPLNKSWPRLLVMSSDSLSVNTELAKIDQELRHTPVVPWLLMEPRGDWDLLVIRFSKHTCQPSELTKGSLPVSLRCLKSRAPRGVEAGSHTPVPHGLCEQFPQNHGFSTPGMSLVCPLAFVYKTLSLCFCISFIFCFICVYEN